MTIKEGDTVKVTHERNEYDEPKRLTSTWQGVVLWRVSSGKWMVQNARLGRLMLVYPADMEVVK